MPDTKDTKTASKKGPSLEEQLEKQKAVVLEKQKDVTKAQKALAKERAALDELIVKIPTTSTTENIKHYLASQNKQREELAKRRKEMLEKSGIDASLLKAE